MVVTVQPRDRSVSIAASPIADGADPPLWLKTLVPELIPDATRDTRIPSIDVWFRFVLLNACVKSPPLTLSKEWAGKLASEVHPDHVYPKLVPLEKLSSGKLDSDEFSYHVA